MTKDTTERTDTTDMAAEQLSDELGKIQIKTVDDNVVLGRVSDVRAEQASYVTLRATLPTGEEISEQMDKPVPWSDDFKFARIVEAQGYDASSVHELVGEEIRIERTDGSWQFDDPQADDEPFRPWPYIRAGFAIVGFVAVSWGITVVCEWFMGPELGALFAPIPILIMLLFIVALLGDEQ